MFVVSTIGRVKMVKRGLCTMVHYHCLVLLYTVRHNKALTAVSQDLLTFNIMNA